AYMGSAIWPDAQMAQWNFTIEHEVAPDWVVHLNYIGSQAYGLAIGVDANQVQPGTAPYDDSKRPFPNFSTITLQIPLGFSSYQAFNPSIEHRFSKGLSFQANYTWAKSIGNAAGDAPTGFGQQYAGGVNDHFNLHNIRGNDAGTRRHRFLA